MSIKCSFTRSLQCFLSLFDASCATFPFKESSAYSSVGLWHILIHPATDKHHDLPYIRSSILVDYTLPLNPNLLAPHPCSLLTTCKAKHLPLGLYFGVERERFGGGRRSGRGY